MIRKILFFIFVILGGALVEEQMLAQKEIQDDKELKDLFDEIDIEALFKGEDDEDEAVIDEDESILAEDDKIDEMDLTKIKAKDAEISVKEPVMPIATEKAKKIELPKTEVKKEELTKIDVAPTEEEASVVETVKEPEIIKAEEIMGKGELEKFDTEAKK